MMSRLFIFVAWFLSAILVHNEQVNAQEKAEETALTFAAKTLENAIRLEIKGNHLQLKYPIDSDKAQQLFSPLSSKLRSGGSSRGTNTWGVRAGDNRSELFVSLAKRVRGINPSPMPDTIQFTINENVKPFRKLQLMQNHGELFCLATNPESQQQVIIIGSSNNPPAAYLLAPDKTLAITLGTSFKTSLREVGKLSQIGKLLAEFGLANDLEQFFEVLTGEIRNQVVQEVGDKESFEALLDQLESDHFETREQAAKSIVEAFTKWEPFILQWQRDPSRGPETRSRIAKIAKDNTSSIRQMAIETINDSKLLFDQESVMDAWVGMQSSEHVDRRFINHLTNITGQSAAKTKKDWLALRKKPESNAIPSRRFLATPVDAKKLIFRFFAKEISNLCRFNTDENGMLRLDRKSWSAQFAHKTPIQLRDEVRNFARKIGAPISMVAPSVNMRIVDHQHLLFLKLNDRADEAQYFGRRHGYAGFEQLRKESQQLRTKHLVASLTVPRTIQGLGAANDDNTDKDRIQIQIGSTNPFGVQMNLVQNSKQTSLFLSHLESGAILAITQTKSRFSIHDIRHNKLFFAKAPSYQEFRNQNAKYFRESFLPTMRAFCVDLGESAGGPFEFKSESLEALNNLYQKT